MYTNNFYSHGLGPAGPQRGKMGQNGPKWAKIAVGIQIFESKTSRCHTNALQIPQHAPNMHTNNFYSQVLGPTDPETATNGPNRPKMIKNSR